MSTLADFSIPRMEKHIFPNGMACHFKKTDAEGLLRLDLVLPAGIQYQQAPLVAALTNSLLKAGSRNMTSAQIAEGFDYYGAFVRYACSLEKAYINLYTPKKFFTATLHLLNEILRYPVFPQNELEISLERMYQLYLIDRQKVQMLAGMEMQSCLFGPEHPYGYKLKDEDFKNLEVSMLDRFHQRHYCSNRCLAFLSGDLDQGDLHLLEQRLGKEPWGDTNSPEPEAPPIRALTPQKVLLPKADSLQAALHFSLSLDMDKNHEDFAKLRFVDTLLGGYFGSRLMSSLREEKGYTYGISSAIKIHQDFSHLDITTQTDVKKADALVQGVYDEIKKIQDQKPDDREMKLVRNYLYGNFARSFDGPFALAEAYMQSCSMGLDMDYYEKQMGVFRDIEAAEVMDLARRYLVLENFYEVRAGGNNQAAVSLIQ